MKAEILIKELEKYKVGPYIEVPCSILEPLINYLLTSNNSYDVINPVSEAVAMGMASGTYLASGRIPVVLMQNSGLGNTINALTSLNQIYKIPAIYIITWRGFPGEKDAPEHYVMGRDMETILNTFHIPYEVIDEKTYKISISRILKKIKASGMPAALILKKGVIDPEKPLINTRSYQISRNKVLDIILGAIDKNCLLVSSNGFISRELANSISQHALEQKVFPFYMLGSMGHALPVALGVAKYMKMSQKIIILDGDGSCMMHLGAMTSVGALKPRQLIHVVLDNGSYASTGYQPTLSDKVNLCNIAKACGYNYVCKVAREYKLKKEIQSVLHKKGASFVHVLINNSGVKKDRVSSNYSCKDIADRFSKSIKNIKGTHV